MNQNQEQKITIDISTRSIIKVFVAVLLLIFLYVIRDVLAVVLVSVIIVAAMSPLVARLSKLRIPRSVSVLAIYLVFFGFLGLLVSLIVPQVASQIRDIAQDAPQFVERASEIFGRLPQHENIARGIETSLKNVSENLAESTTNVLGAIFKIFGEIVTFFVILVLVLYISVAEGGIKAFFKSITPKAYEEKVKRIMEKVQVKIGHWVRGEALLMLAVGILVFVGLKILGIKYALTLAVIAGLLEIVPVMGPLISSIPAIIIGFAQSPILGLLAAILYIVVQQAENHLLVPTVMGKTTGIPPVVVIISLLIGAKLLGILGILLAVPVAVILSVFVEEFVSNKVEEKT